MKIKELNKLIECFGLSYSYSLDINANIKLRIALSDFMKYHNIVNFFPQFQLAIKNFLLLLRLFYHKQENAEVKGNLEKKIYESTLKILKTFIQKDNEYVILNKKIKEISCNPKEMKELKDYENLIKNFLNPIKDYIFPLLKKIHFYENEKYKDKFANIFFELIMCSQPIIREKIKDYLSLLFQSFYKDKEKDN